MGNLVWGDTVTASHDLERPGAFVARAVRVNSLNISPSSIRATSDQRQERAIQKTVVTNVCGEVGIAIPGTVMAASPRRSSVSGRAGSRIWTCC